MSDKKQYLYLRDFPNYRLEVIEGVDGDFKYSPQRKTTKWLGLIIKWEYIAFYSGLGNVPFFSRHIWAVSEIENDIKNRKSYVK